MRHLQQAVSTFRRRSGVRARRLSLVTSTVAGLGASMFITAGLVPAASFISTPTLAKNLADEDKRARGWLGVRIQAITAEIAESMGLKAAEGALVAEPQPNSPASKAGLRAGDVITSIDGERIKDASELARKIAAAQPGSTIELGIVRDGAEQMMTVTLSEMRRDAQAAGEQRATRVSDEPRIGLMVTATENTGAGEQGLLVTAIDPTGMAAGQGLRIGDIILEVGGRAVKTPDDMRKALADARSAQRKNVFMRVKSGEVTKFVGVPLARA